MAKDERELFDRAAKQLGLTYQYVRCIGVGIRHSATVAAALKAERAKMRKAKPDNPPRKPSE